MKLDEKSLDDIIIQFQNKMYGKAKDLSSRHINLMEILDLGDQYDNPDKVLQAGDLLSNLYAYYAMLFHHSNEKLEKYNYLFKIWKSKQEEKIKEKLYNNNIEKGMTANNAKPTAADILNRYNQEIVGTEQEKKWSNIINKWSERVSYLRIMRDTVDRRREIIGNMINLLSTCIKTGIFIPKSIKTISSKNKSKIKMSSLYQDDV